MDRAPSQYHRFLHNDVQLTNVMVHDGRYQALIDWGDAGWGDPTLDFRSLPARTVRYALEGYREVGLPDGNDTIGGRITWDHLSKALCHLERGPVPGRKEWNRPPGARFIELLALASETRSDASVTPSARLAATLDRPVVPADERSGRYSGTLATRLTSYRRVDRWSRFATFDLTGPTVGDPR